MVPQVMVFSGPVQRYRDSACNIPVDFYGDLGLELVLDKSDHIWLFFLNREEFIEKFHLNHKYLGRNLDIAGYI